MKEYLRRFLAESLAIEGIMRPPTNEEIEATDRFLASPLTVDSVVALVKVYQPDAELREREGLNVRVGNHVARQGGPWIRPHLDTLLMTITQAAVNPWRMHCEYETLHPFTDGNGRSGRAIWLWHMLSNGEFRGLTFLHHFYYQTLENFRS